MSHPYFILLLFLAVVCSPFSLVFAQAGRVSTKLAVTTQANSIEQLRPKLSVSGARTTTSMSANSSAAKLSEAKPSASKLTRSTSASGSGKITGQTATRQEYNKALTEAGVSAAGFGSRTYNQPVYSSVGNYTESSGTSESGLFQSFGGILNVFAMAQAMAQRSNLAVDGPIFTGECRDCPPNSRETVVNASGTVEDAHNTGAIIDAINNEPTLPYPGLAADIRQSYVDATIASLNEFGGLALLNSGEFTSLCPNFENLNPNQMKAAIVYVYSEVFKQTSNYNASLVTPATGGRPKKVGLCQIDYQETKEMYADYGEPLSYDEVTFNSELAVDPKDNIVICTSLLFRAAEANNVSSAKHIQNRFPNVNFAEVRANMQKLKMCQASSVAI